MADQQRARAAVQDAITELRTDKATFARTVDINRGTLHAFLSGERWPRGVTFSKIESHLGWKLGTIEAIAEGEPVPPIRVADDTTKGVLLDMDPAVLEGLSPEAQEEILTEAKLTVLRAARQIRQAAGED